MVRSLLMHSSGPQPSQFQDASWLRIVQTATPIVKRPCFVTLVSATVRPVTEELLTLRQWIGQAVRRLRDEHGRRQDDVAVAARSVGLAWTRGKVAELERGGKAIPAEELLLLPVVLAYAGCGEPQLR